MRSFTLFVVTWFVLSGCRSNMPGDFQRFEHVDVYFGRDIPDPSDAPVDRQVSEAMWDEFLDSEVVPHFAGVTVRSAEGRWFDGNKVIREQSIVLTLLYPAAEEAKYLALIRRIAHEYVVRFEQQAVLIERRGAAVRFEEGD